MKKLNMGCGPRKLEGYVGVDITPFKEVDKVMDLNLFPYDFDDNTFDEVLIENILEHLDNPLRVLEEVWRISLDGAIIKIKVPFYNSSGAWGDITHQHSFCFTSFEYLTEKKNLSDKPREDNPNRLVGYGYTKCFFEIIKIKGIPTKIGRFIPNIRIKMQGITGLRDCLAHIFGEIISDIYIELEVKKCKTKN